MESVRIGIITAPRDGGTDTLSRTIETMDSNDALSKGAEVGVFADAESVPVPKRVGYVECRTCEELAAQREARILGRYYGATNVSRALRWASSASVAVVSEDDMLAAGHWLQRALALLQAAERDRRSRPAVCLSHNHTEMVGHFDPTGIREGEDDLWLVREDTWPNGYSPVVMRGEVAAWAADAIEATHSAVQPDVAIIRAFRKGGAGSLYYADPCMALHMNLSSTYAPGRNPWDATTKRFRPR